MAWIARRAQRSRELTEERSTRMLCQLCGAAITDENLFYEVKLNESPPLIDEDDIGDPEFLFFCYSCLDLSTAPKRFWFYDKTRWDSPWWKLVQWRGTGDEYHRTCVVLRIPGGYLVLALGTALPTDADCEVCDDARPQG